MKITVAQQALESKWRHDSQHNDIQHNDNKSNVTLSSLVMLVMDTFTKKVLLLSILHCSVLDFINILQLYLTALAI
jgi:hypothetical protein